MKLRVFGISDDATLARLDETNLSPSWQQDDAHRWVDVEAATREELEELEQLLAPLALPGVILDACLRPERTDRFLSRRTALYMEAPTHPGWDQPDKPYISVLCLRTTIVTIHRDPLHTVEDVIRDLDADVPLYARSSSALLYYLLVEIGKRNVDAALDVRAEAERLDQTCHQQPDSLDPQEIATLRRKVSHYAAVRDDHAYCVGVLQTVESEAFRVSEQSGFFHDMLRLSELSRRLVDGAEARVASLQRDYELSVQNRVDNRLRFLSVLSAVFLPLTLISAVYGMNFTDLPAMNLSYGYLVVITLMLATAGLTAGYLYWRGWFD